jgi:hypothetical protein
MLRWILGIILALVVLAAGTCWYGYTKLTEGGSTAVVQIATTQDRAWRYLSDPDSMVLWQDSTTDIRVWSDTMPGLALGDSVQMGNGDSSGKVRTTMTWVLTRIDAPTALAWSAVGDSSGTSIMGRTDSLTARGDSVEIRITFEATLFDSLRQIDSVGGLTGRLLGGTSNMMVSMMRLTTEAQLGKLKALLERR